MFKSIANIVPETEKGVAKIEHFEISQPTTRMFIGREPYITPGKYCSLKIDGELWMSDTNFEKRTNQHLCWEANGKVLIAGLGIGLILSALLEKPEVESVLVIEKHRDVIDLVGPHYESEKLQIVCADIFEWKPAKGQKFDTVYFDIWKDVCTDNLEDINKLHQRFKHYLNRQNKDCFMDSWQVEALRYRRQQEKRQGWY